MAPRVKMWLEVRNDMAWYTRGVGEGSVPRWNDFLCREHPAQYLTQSVHFMLNRTELNPARADGNW